MPSDMKTLRLDTPRRLYVSLPVAFAMNVLGFVAFIAHADSPHSWFCTFEYIGLPGLVLGYVIGGDLPVEYAEVVVLGMAAVSFLAWAWLIDRWLSSRYGQSKAAARESSAVA